MPWLEQGMIHLPVIRFRKNKPRTKDLNGPREDTGETRGYMQIKLNNKGIEIIKVTGYCWPYMLSMHNEIHLIVPRNAITDSACKTELL